jgi:hypothetical protein
VIPSLRAPNIAREIVLGIGLSSHCRRRTPSSCVHPELASG